MAVRSRSLLLAAALGLASALALGAPAQAQDVTTTTVVSFGGGGADPSSGAVTTSGVDAVADPSADAGDGVDTSQEITTGTSSESSLLTESRKVAATVGGLVVCALGLTLLTIRYVRATRPVPPVEPGDPTPLRPGGEVTGTAAAIAAAPLPASAAPVPAEPAPVATDHARADADYEPQGTGEHARVELPVGTHRPGRAARLAALGRTAPG